MIRTFEGTMIEAKDPIDAEHYTTVATATAQALADEIASRIDGEYTYRNAIIANVHTIVAATLTQWFLGKFRPDITTTEFAPDATCTISVGTVTDPSDGAPTVSENSTPPSHSNYDTTHERDIDLGSKLNRLIDD